MHFSHPAQYLCRQYRKALLCCLMLKGHLDHLNHRGIKIRSFEKGLADRGGRREEILQRPEIQAAFLYPFSYAPLGEWGHISGELFGLLLRGFVCRQPPPANPFSKPPTKSEFFQRAQGSKKFEISSGIENFERE